MARGKTAGAVAVAGHATRRSFTKEQVVQKKINDNFRSWGPADTDVRLVNELSLRQLLLRDYDLHLAGKEPKVMGSVYYAGLRDLYKSTFEPSSALMVVGTALTINPRLVNAMCAAKRAHADRSPLVAFIQTCEKPNQSEMVGLVQYFLTLKARCVKQLAVAMDVIRFVVRCSLDTEYPLEFAVLRSWIDEILEQALLRNRANHTLDSMFCDLHVGSLCLLMPKAELKQVLKNKGDQSAVADQISKLVGSSQIGLRLFAASIHGVVAIKVQAAIDARVTAFFTKKSKLSIEGMSAEQSQCQQEVEKIACVDLLPKRRSIILQYRGKPIKLKIASPQEQVQLSYACALKSLGVASKQLLALWVEELLVPSSTTCSLKASVPDSVFASAVAARNRLKQIVLDANAVTGDLVQQALLKASPDLLVIDPTFKVEIGIVEELTGEGTGSRMQELILKCLPSAGKHVPPETAAQLLHSLVGGEAFKLADRSSQEKAKVIQSFVNSLAQQRAPDLADALKSDFMSRIVAQFQFFLVSTAAASSTSPRIMRTDAIEPLLASASTRATAGTATMSDVWPFRAYAWFLSPAQSEKAQALLRDVEEKWRNDLGESMRKRQRTKQDDPAKSSGKAEVDKAMSESLELFK